MPETTLPTRPGWSRDFQPAEAFPYWCDQARQWHETIQARTPALPITRRHTIPVYVVSHASQAAVIQGLFAHGLAVIDARWEVARALVQAMNRELARTSDWSGFVTLYEPFHGWVHFCVYRQDADDRESDLERALAVAAIDAWTKAGKPATYMADLEVDTRTRKAYEVDENGERMHAEAAPEADPPALKISQPAPCSPYSPYTPYPEEAPKVRRDGSPFDRARRPLLFFRTWLARRREKRAHRGAP